MINVIWDMETGDPDDFLTLLLLIGHPDVNLQAVNVTIGTPDQIGIVRFALDKFGLNIPVGSYNINHPKKCVSEWHYKTFGNISESRDAEYGPELLYNMCDDDTILITGAPLKNLGQALIEYPSIKIGKLFAQGGFAGDGVVEEHKQLEKFKGMVTCPTYNLNGDPKGGLRVISCNNIKEKYFISKNVCHGVCYNEELHSVIGEIRIGSQHLNMIWKAMDRYLFKKKEKKFHDPLAACAAIDKSIIEWREVSIFRDKGGWGSRLCNGSNIWISIDYDRDKFIKTLVKH